MINWKGKTPASLWFMGKAGQALWLGVSGGAILIWEALTGFYDWFRSEGWHRSDPW